jgi:hypothetical protein
MRGDEGRSAECSCFVLRKDAKDKARATAKANAGVLPHSTSLRARMTRH